MARFDARTLLSLSLTLSLVACGGDDVSTEPSVTVQERDREVEDDFEDGKADDPSQEDEEPVDEEPVAEEPPPELELPLIESIRFMRKFKDCSELICVVDVEFSMRSGLMTRYQFGARVDSRRLYDEDYETLKDLVLDEAFLERMKEVDFDCPERTEDDPYNVTLNLGAFYGEGDMRYFQRDVSGCYASEASEGPDAFVAFALEMEDKYEIE